jgi:hypothetical protein
MANHILLQKIRLTSAASSVTFANIPQSGYTDLKIVVSTRCSTANTAAAIRFNNDSASNYSSRRLGGDNTASYASSTTNISQLQWLIIPFASTTANTFGNAEIYVTNYLSTSNVKSLLFESISEGNSSTKDSTNMEMNVGLWSKTPEAISSVTIVSGGGDLVAGSTFSLYGVAATGTSAITGPKADGGNSITTDGTYWYHTFLTSGFFKPIQSLTCNYLVVGGGGPGAQGGSSSSGAGGGGGGSSSATLSAASNTNYTITVGAGSSSGGVAGSSSAIFGSGITTITANGGDPERANRVGGLGGTGTSGTGGTGGNGVIGSSVGNGTNGAAGNTFSISGTSTTYGGGGGGAGRGGGTHGTGGAGGGGNAGSTGSPGTANTGGGGGGTQTDNVMGGNGGSGIIIIRYPV